MRYPTAIALACLLAVLTGTTVAGAASPQTPATTSEAKALAGPVVNINTATAAQLEALPGIGPKMASLIVEYRQKNGNFKKIEELMNVKGIGEKSFLKLKGRLTIGAPAAGTAAR